MKTIKLKIGGMHCTSCALSIDWELEDTKGVKESKTNYAKQISEIIFDENIITEDGIIKIIDKVGYKSIPV